MNDPIIAEVRSHRAAIAAENGNDLRRICESARRRQGSGGRRMVSFVPVSRTTAPSDSCTLREEPPEARP